MKKICIFLLIIFQFILANNFNWLVEIDCDDDLNFFEIRTLNTYNLSNCNSKYSKWGVYKFRVLFHYS